MINKTSFDIIKAPIKNAVKFPNMKRSESAKAAGKLQILPGGFAGTGPNGSFFEAPAWVDQSKAPGQVCEK